MQTYRPHQRDAHAAVSSATLYPRTHLQNHQQPRGAEHADEPMAVRETHHLVRSRLLGIDNDRAPSTAVTARRTWPGPSLYFGTQDEAEAHRLDATTTKSNPTTLR